MEETLSALDAARILFGDDQLGDPGFDPSSAQFVSGADVCERLAARFGFTDNDYDQLARQFRLGGERVEVYEWRRNAQTGYLDKVRTKMIGEVHDELREILGEYPDGGEEYFSVMGSARDDEWPEGDIVCYSVNGSSEGDYVHIDVQRDGKRQLVMVAKTFMGRDASWAFARRLADLLEIQ